MRRGVTLSTATSLLLVPWVPALAHSFNGGAVPGLFDIFDVAKMWVSKLPATEQNGEMLPHRWSPPSRVTPHDPPTKAEREAKVASLTLNVPGKVQLETGQSMALTAVPVDYEGNAVHGLVAEWSSSNEQAAFVHRDGRVVAGKAGSAIITASAGRRKEHVRITVGEGLSPRAGRARGAEVRKFASDAGGPKLQIIKAGWTASDNTRATATRSAASGARLLRVALAQSQPNIDPLPNEETSSLYSPANTVGVPPGKVKPGAAGRPATVDGTETGGRANFTFGLPVVSLPSRGMNVTLGLTYNSHVWNESTSFNGSKRLTYDVDRGWPAPGFRLGYGHVENQGGQGCTLVEPDGTRRELAQVTWVSTHGYDSFETTDGSFIRYYGNQWPNWLHYPDGTRVELTGGSGTYSYPVRITDRNGNYTSISYVDNTGPRVSSVQDTMGRYVRFHYDAAGSLVAVTAPGYGGGLDRQVVRLYYADVTINTAGSFQGATVSAPATARVITHVFYPGSNTGYRFDYSPSYGVIRQLRRLRGVSISYMGLDQTGVVTSEGETAATTLYNYPSAPSALSAAPLYTQRCDDWAGRTAGMNGDVSQWPCYDFADDPATGESTVTAPDGTVTLSRSIVSADETLNGLVTETEVKHGTTTYSKVRTEWGTDAAGSNQRRQKVFATNEAGQTRALVYSYTSYNNVSAVSERDFTADPNALGAELRRTEFTYETRPEWVNRRLLRLVTSMRVFAGGATLPAARTDYAYDTAGSNLTRRDDAVMHEDAYDPFAPSVTSCYWDCIEMPDGRCRRVWVCETTNPYDPATDKRGNVTQVTRYADAAGATGTLVETASYDITGNVVSQTAGCCSLKTGVFSKAYEYAYPTAETSGGAGQLTLGASYDFNTGLLRTATDENGRVTTIDYYPDTLRHYSTHRPDGGFTESIFEDNLVADPDASRKHTYAATRTYTGAGPTGDANSYLWQWTFFDGRGEVARAFRRTGQQGAADAYSTSDIEYDLMARVRRVSNPYYAPNGSQNPIPPSAAWTTYEYDRLGRTVKMIPPDGNAELQQNIVRIDYAGTAVTVTDQTGAQRRQVLDALGRVARTDEANGAGQLGDVGSPTQPTSYLYNALDKLVRIMQDTQKRFFKYDSLGRLTHERQVEQAAPHYAPDSLTDNNYWSRRVEYNGHGLVANAFDARGVRTEFAYDGLNRLTQINYFNEPNTTPEVRTPSVVYTFDQARPGYFNHGRLTEVKTVTSAGVTQTVQAYDYDSVGQVVGQRQTVEGRTYAIGYGYDLAGRLTNETYPSGRAVSHAFNPGGLVSSLGDATRAYASGLVYAAHGALQSENLGNGAAHTYSYNSRLDLKQVKLTVAGVERQRYDYEYGQVNHATGAVDPTKNNGQVARVEGFIDGAKQWQQRLSYDLLGRLSSAREVRGDGQQSWHIDYTYDRYGNRFQAAGQAFGVPVSEADVDQQTNRFKSGVTYDAAGNVTADAKFRSMQYLYDANGRMRWSAYVGNTGQSTAVYDGLGQRVASSAGGLTRDLVYDIFGRAVAEYQSNGVWERDYVYRGGLLLATAEASGAVRYLTIDHQGSARVVMNEGGGIVARRDYLPFGEEAGAGVGWRLTAQGYNSPDAARQRYALLVRDDATGLEHTPWRKLETRAGRWTTPDPYRGSMTLSDPQSFNRYAYVRNDPVNLTDPSGLDSEADPEPGTPCDSDSDGYIDGIIGEDGKCYRGPSEEVTVSGGGENPFDDPFFTDFDEQGIRTLLQNALKNPKCASFIKAMLDAVAKDTNNPLHKGGDILTLHNDFLSGKGGYTREKPEGSAGYGNAMGLIAKGNASMFLAEINKNVKPADGSSLGQAQTRIDAIGTLHELMHLAGSKRTYTDRAFVEAMRKNPAYANMSRAPYPGDPGYRFKEKAKNPNDGVWSSYWGDVLNQLCWEGK